MSTAVTTMLSTTSLAKQLAHDYPELAFKAGDDFVWSPETRTILFRVSDQQNETWALLHELSHAVLGHDGFTNDIELIKKEVEAWHHARDALAPHYQLAITDTYIDTQLDSYRDWLHARSLCPRCRQTGLQTHTRRYSCMNCNVSWRVNDARRCALRRHLEAA